MATATHDPTYSAKDLQDAAAWLSLFEQGVGLEINVSRDLLDVTTDLGHDEPDPEWRHTDKNGHRHKWLIPGPGMLGRSEPSLPTLRKIWDELQPDPEDGDFEDEDRPWHYECRKCVALVEPGTRYVLPPEGRQFTGGLITPTINGTPVRPEVLEIVSKAMRSKDPSPALEIVVPERKRKPRKKTRASRRKK